MEGSPPKSTEEPLFGPVPEWAIGTVAGLALLVLIIVLIVFYTIRGRNRKKLGEREKHARAARRVTSRAPPVRFPETVTIQRRQQEPVNKSMSLSRDVAIHRSKKSGKSEIVDASLKPTPISVTMNKESSTISMAGKEGSSIVLLKSQTVMCSVSEIPSSSAASFTPRQGIKPVIENQTVTKSLGPTSMASITTIDDATKSSSFVRGGGTSVTAMDGGDTSMTAMSEL